MAATVAKMETCGRVRRILTDEDPLLRQVSSEASLDDPELRSNIADLAATLQDFRARAGFGRAISAPQIGVLKRVVVLNLGTGAVPLLNPHIVARSNQIQRVWDDCLSVPDKLVQVDRHKVVSICYHATNGNQVTWNDLRPDLAELLQHEIDHLDGILMTDRMIADSIRPLSERAALVGTPART